MAKRKLDLRVTINQDTGEAALVAGSIRVATIYVSEFESERTIVRELLRCAVIPEHKD